VKKPLNAAGAPEIKEEEKKKKNQNRNYHERNFEMGMTPGVSTSSAREQNLNR